MSSHHIVREKQEPALLILGLNNFDDEQLGQLLEWSPTVFTTPLTAEKLNSYGIKVDWIVSDESEGNLQSDIKHLLTNGLPLVEAALKYMVSAGYPAVNVVTDEFNLADYIDYADKINLVIFHQQQKIYAVKTGFSKWKPAGENISLLNTPKNLQTTGLQKLDETQFITTADGLFSIGFDGALLFIAEGF